MAAATNPAHLKRTLRPNKAIIKRIRMGCIDEKASKA
jgi:hypothetical protein